MVRRFGACLLVPVPARIPVDVTPPVRPVPKQVSFIQGITFVSMKIVTPVVSLSVSTCSIYACTYSDLSINVVTYCRFLDGMSKSARIGRLRSFIEKALDIRSRKCIPSIEK